METEKLLNGSLQAERISEWRKGIRMTKIAPPEMAREQKHGEIVLLLERFVANPALTRRELRVKFGVLDGVAAEIFAAMIFLCDELLQIRRTRASHQKSAAADATRFLVIAKKLPMELQMVLSYRVVGSRKMNVLRRESEAAFKDLARILLLD